MKTPFEDLDWHDATLKSVFIDRKAPGKNDDVIFDVEWPDGACCSVVFHGCYYFAAELHFGIIASESILSAVCLENAQSLTELRNKWAKIGVNLDDLRCFEVRTNSTAGVLRVFARDFTLVSSTAR